MSERTVEVVQHGAAAWVWMDRPELHNALNENLIAELTQAFWHVVNVALRTQLDEVCPLEGRLGKQNAVIRNDADGITADMREAGDERGAVALLELV